MAWTTPATWTAGQLVDADDLNEQLRDNMTYLYGRGYGEKRLSLPMTAAQPVMGTAMNSAAVELVASSTVTTTPSPQWYQARFDGATQEGRVWQFVLPGNYGGAPYVVVSYNSGTASVAGSTTIWGVQVAAVSNTDLWTGKAFAAANLGTSTVAGTAHTMNYATVSISNTDSWAALDNVSLLLYRSGTADTFEQDACVLMVDLYWS